MLLGLLELLESARLTRLARASFKNSPAPQNGFLGVEFIQLEQLVST